MDDFFFFGFCLTVGVVSGFLGGLFGIGGGIVIVPALALFYEFTQHIPSSSILLVSVATSLACIGFTSASAAWTQHRAGYIDWTVFRRLIAFLLIGSFAAGFIAPNLSDQFMRVFIGLFLLAVSVVMLSKWQPNPTRAFPGTVGSASLGLSGGTAAGLVGIAGGNIVVPALIFFNVPVHRATATASAMGVPIALVGALGYYLSSIAARGPDDPAYIDFTAALPIIIGALLAAPLGVKTAHKLDPAVLKKAFGVLLVFVSLRILYSAI